MRVDQQNAPYVMTKPFNASQEMIGEYFDGAIWVKLKVHHNLELVRLILEFGAAITVLQPRRLRQSASEKIATRC